MLFNESFLDGISDRPVDSILEICRIARANLSDSTGDWLDEDYDVLVEAFALLRSMEEGGMFNSPTYPPNIIGEPSKDCTAIYTYLSELEANFKAESLKLKFEFLKSKFKSSLTAGFCYEFSQGDLDRVQTLINELREAINGSDQFEGDHRRRLLARLEKLQAELHKKMSNLDMLYGLVGDAGVVIGKFGHDVKPIVDRLREIVEIVWRTQARAEELPSDAPFPGLEDKLDHTEIA